MRTSAHAIEIPLLLKGLFLPIAFGISGCNMGSDADSSVSQSFFADKQRNELPTSKVGARQMERLDRGLIAVPSANGVLVSWRILDSDDKDFEVDVYRNGLRLSADPVHGVSNFLDTQGANGDVYSIRSSGRVLATTKAWQAPYLEIPITPPKDAVAPDGTAYSYTANDASVGDLDGDGRYEIVLKWDPTNSKDNSQGGYTGDVFIDAYTLEGEQLWRINLGANIRAGAHYTQFMVYDFDGDGRAEIAMKTADGTTDGLGNVLGDPDADWVAKGGELEVTDRTGSIVTDDGRLMAQLKGRVLDGPEYFSVFEGSTGRVLDSVRYIPQRGSHTDSPSTDDMIALWGDGYGNRSERYLAGVAYLDGVRPSIIMARGYYTRTVVAAYDFRRGRITARWVFDSSAPGVSPQFGGQGNHQLSVADIDSDGFDEIVYGSMAIDHDGSPLWTTNLGHGDAMHVSDLDPNNPGLEMFGVYEDVRNNGGIGSALINVSDGKILWAKPAEKDNGRGLAADIDPRHPGAETWALNSEALYNAAGESVASLRPTQVNFAIWWDGDLLRELLDGTVISKWDWVNGVANPIMIAEGALSNNGTKATPALSGDILGDWREELVLRSEDNRSLKLYSSSIPSEHGFTTLMQNSQYRLSIAWQNTAYNQPPHPSFFLGSRDVLSQK